MKGITFEWDAKKASLDALAATLGVNKAQLTRELLKLARTGIIKIEGNNVIYTGSAS